MKEFEILKKQTIFDVKTSKMMYYICLAFIFVNVSYVKASANRRDAEIDVSQQSITINGRVSDRNGEPIIGANILETGTTNGTTSDVEGNFRLSVKGAQSVLQISYIGYLTQNITIGARTTLQVVLYEDAALLDEVVVIGYGIQRKGDITSAIVGVKAEEFQPGKIQDAAELVKGKVAGLTIAKSSGDPNASSGIMLRGVNTLEGSVSPLVLVDGIPGSLTTVAPENVAEIDVLKDASAAAIYGTRGANGVILITTKSGRREQQVSAVYSAYVSTSDFLKRVEFMRPSDIRFGKTAFSDDGWDTDWLKAVTQKGFTNNHSLSIDGGTKSLAYSTNITYRKELGTIKKTDKEEIRIQLNLTQKLMNDVLTINLRLLKGLHKNTNSNSTNADQTNIYRQALIHNPTSPIYNEDGTYFEEFNRYLYYNPVSMVNERIGLSESEWTDMTGNITVEPIKGWQTNLMLGRSLNSGGRSNYETVNYFASLTSGHKNGASKNYDKGVEDNLELTSRYDWNTALHRFSALAGYAYYHNEYDGFNAWNQYFPTDIFLYNSLNTGAYLKEGKAGMGSYKNSNKLISFFGRISYGYNNRYNVLASIRREGSSRFGTNNKWGTFYGLSGGWTLSNEEFMKSLRKTINNLKIRLGYGLTGQNATENYRSLTMYDYKNSGGTVTYYMNMQGNWVEALQITQNPNPDLRWETTSEINLGIDFGLWSSRLNGSIDLYHRRTNDLLFWYNVPFPPNLYGQTLANVGSIQNRGVEAMLGGSPVRTNDFEWNTTLTASHNQNKLLNLSNDLYQTDEYMNTGGLGEPVTAPTHRVEIGKGLGNFWGLKSVGVTEDGHWIIEDPNTGEYLAYSTSLNDDHYRQYLGNGFPKIVAGWNNALRFKNFDLNIQMTGQFGFQILNEQRVFYENNSIQYNKLKSAANPVYGIVPLANNQQQVYVSYYVEDGDYVKFDNVTLGYTYIFPENKYLKSVRLYASGQNLYTITKYSGLDPEINNWHMAPGVDPRDKYPMIRSFTFGLNINF